LLEGYARQRSIAAVNSAVRWEIAELRLISIRYWLQEAYQEETAAERLKTVCLKGFRRIVGRPAARIFAGLSC